MSTRDLTCALCMLLLQSCGGRVVFSADGDALDCEEVTFDIADATEECFGDATCSLSSRLADGRVGVIECTNLGEAPSCELRIEGELACVCAADTIDFANVCSNGVPTCSDWSINRIDLVPCGE